jgi:hypothetical protein
MDTYNDYKIVKTQFIDVQIGEDVIYATNSGIKDGIYVGKIYRPHSPHPTPLIQHNGEIVADPELGWAKKGDDTKLKKFSILKRLMKH